MTMTAERQLVSINHLSETSKKSLPKLIENFLDTVVAATERASYYSSKKEQQEAIENLHKEIFRIDRGAYGLCLLLPNLNDYSKQLGLGYLLDNPRDGEAILTAEQEAKLIPYLAKTVEPQRMIKAFLQLRQNRVNNGRTRKLILRCILQSPKLEFWAVKYRTKLRKCLEHAWGKSVYTSIRKTMVKKHGIGTNPWTNKQKQTIDKYILKHLQKDLTEKDVKNVLQCVAFIQGFEGRLTLPKLKAYKEARTDISKGQGIPKEQLFYLRSRFHLDSVTKEQVYDLAKSTMTGRVKAQTQKASRAAGAKIDFDPNALDAVRLYIYAFEMGMTDEIKQALKKKAAKAAAGLMTKCSKVGIVVDCSHSMRGDNTQKFRPMAISLATRDMLVAGSDSSFVEYCGSRGSLADLTVPRGSTSLAEALVSVLKNEPDAVYVLSDGYENAPAGRFHEVVEILRSIGNNTPITQVSPVVASEKGGALRSLSQNVNSVPINQPIGLNMQVFKSLLSSNVEDALLGLARHTLPQLDS